MPTIGRGIEPGLLLPKPNFLPLHHLSSQYSIIVHSFMCVQTGNIQAIVVVTMMGRFFITFSINVVTQWTYEIMPTQLRAQGAALANSMGGLCQVASPYIAYSVRKFIQKLFKKLHFIYFTCLLRVEFTSPCPSSYLELAEFWHQLLR
jgi:hypothetical protein